MRLIDADALLNEMQIEREIYNGEARRGFNNGMCSVYDAPTIDAEPVVRCKECMYFKEWTLDFMGDTVEVHSCSYNRYGTNRDDYCSRGKRRKP